MDREHTEQHHWEQQLQQREDDRLRLSEEACQREQQSDRQDQVIRTTPCSFWHADETFFCLRPKLWPAFKKYVLKTNLASFGVCVLFWPI